MSSNANPRARKKCLIVYHRAKGHPCYEIADIVRIDDDTVTKAVKKYIQVGLACLLKELFEKQPPDTVNQDIEIVFEETGVRLKHSACQSFLKKIDMKCRRCGLVPGKAVDDEKQCEAQQEFHDQKLQPLLDEAKQGKRTVLFVDASHFVMGAFGDGVVLHTPLTSIGQWPQASQHLGRLRPGHA